MAEKRKLPARERRDPAAKRRVSEATPQSSRRKASTPVVVRTPAPEPVPEPTPVPVEEPLPTKIKDGEALPTRLKPQPSILCDKEYQTIAESAVLLVSLERSKKKWLSDGIFERYWTKPKKTKREQIEGKNPPKESMTKVGPCKIIIEPHHFDGMIYTVKDPNAKAHVQIPPQQRHIVHYGPPPPSNGYHYQHYAPPNQMRPPPYNYHPPPHPQNAQPRPLPPPAQRQPSSQPPPPPPPPAKPSPDPVIQMLATRAAANPELKALMRVVASSKASQEQLRTFQAHIDELNAIIRQREEQQRRQQQSQPPQPRPPQQSPQPQAQPGQTQVTQPQQQDQTQPPQPQVTPSPAPPASVSAPAQNPPQTQSTPNGSSQVPTPTAQLPVSDDTTPVKPEPDAPAAATISQGQPPATAPSVAAAPSGPSPSPAPAASPAPGPVPQASPAPRPLPPSPAPPAGSPYPNGPPPYPPYPASPYQNTPPPLKARNPPHYGPVSGPHGAYYQNGPTQPPPKPPIKAVVFEFTSPLTPYGSSTSGHAGSGDRYLFPENTILEYQAGGTIVIASFLIVRKVDQNTKFPIESPSDVAPKSKSKSTKSKKKDKEKAENGNASTPAPEKKNGDAGQEKVSDSAATADKGTAPPALADSEKSSAAKDDQKTPDPTVKKESTENNNPNLKEYYQPMTLRIYSSKPATLEPLSRIVKPAAEVRKYMEEVMDRAERAPSGFLAYRLPREENAPGIVDPQPEVDTNGNNKKKKNIVELGDGKSDHEGAEEPEVLEDDGLKEYWDAPSGLVPLPA